MNKSSKSENLSLVGEVVELRDRNGKRSVKVILRAGCLDLPQDGSLDLRLGDRLLIELKLSGLVKRAALLSDAGKT